MADMISEETMRNNVDYLDFKTELLCQIGMNDSKEVKAYLKSKCANATTELKRRIQIDNAARTIMDAYYDGDRTFTKAKKKDTKQVLCSV